MDWIVISVGILSLLGASIALYFLPGWLRRGDIIWLVIVAALLSASGAFILALFAEFTSVGVELRALNLFFWVGVLVALNGTIILKLPRRDLR